MKITKKDKKTLGVIVVVILVCAILFDLSPFGGNLRFYAKWTECGRKPLEAMGGFGTGIPWYKEPSVYAPVRGQVLFCTPGEAERAGYSSDSSRWQQNNLDQE